MDPEPWRILIDAGRSAAQQMAYDERLAHETIPTVRFFTWRPEAMSLGHRQPRPDWLKGAGARGLQVVERPTGGGIAFHGSDLSLAVVVPRLPAPRSGMPDSARQAGTGWPLTTVMEAACRSAASVLERFGVAATVRLDGAGQSRIAYCLTEPSPYAVFAAGRKMAGFAIRRYPESWLIQGSLLVRPIPAALSAVLPAEARERLALHAVALQDVTAIPVTEEAVAQRWASNWAAWWGVREPAAASA